MFTTSRWLAGILLLAMAGLAQAQYPDRPIRIIVPFVAGGVSDILSRQLVQKITEQTGKVLVVDNRVGAGGRIGYEAGARAAPDGYTLTATDATYTMMPGLYPKLPWEHTDLAPVALVSQMPFAVVTRQGSGFTSFGELVAQAKAAPGKFNYGSAGIGSVNHVVTELFRRSAGIEITHVPYKGMGDAVSGLLSGSIDILVTAVPTAMGQIKGGRMVALGVTSATRSTALPGVVTATEAGIPFAAANWFALTMPKGSPKEAFDWLQKSVAAALAAPDLRERILAQGAEPTYLAQEALGQMMQSETRRWGDVTRSARIHAE